jgi:hydrogenase nickel incorporation protein HypB
MCERCGCAVTAAAIHAAADVTLRVAGAPTDPAQATHSLEVLQRLLSANDATARHNRDHLQHHGVLAVNLMSSPGSGKTALLEATIDALKEHVRIAVIEGDLETENDAQRIRAHGVSAVQITTGTACHLDAHLVHAALHRVPLDEIDLLLIENVGNLVCPAAFDLGQHYNVALLAVTEGDDKPSKYPVMFRAADLVVLTKTDLLPVLDDFEPQRAQAALRALGRDTPMIRTAARRTPAIDPWLQWLLARLDACRSGLVRPGRAPQRAALPES